MIYHITARDAWEKAKAVGFYTADSLPSDGFIHCSTASQLNATANLFFHGCRDLVLLYIDDRMLGSALEYENLEGGADLFPHVYAALPLDTIREVQDLTPRADGSFMITLAYGE
jgi:uncharacterized protein (DUF952 family)